MEDTHQRLLVDLDSILDTRLGTLARISPELAREAAGEKYLKRETDKLGTVLGKPEHDEAFKRLYAERDTDTLKASVMSQIVLMVNEMTRGWEQLMKSTPHVEDIAVDLNVYPYKLSAEEKDELEKVVLHYSALETQVSVIDVPIKRLTPRHLDSRYSSVIMYDFNGWMEYHGKSLPENKIPSLTFIVPRLYPERPPTEEEIKKEGFESIDAYTALQFGLAEFISIQAIPVEHFCILRV